VPEPLELTASLNLAGTILHEKHVEACPDIGPICQTVPQPPYQHDQHLYTLDFIGDVELGLLSHLAVEVLFTVRTVVERIRFLDLEDRPYTPPVADYHHRSETLFGPTDPWLMLHLGFDWEGFMVTARGGVTAPIGSTVPDPFRLGDLGLPHEHIQFGTGTIDPVGGLSIQRRIGFFTLTLWTLDRIIIGTNGYGYHGGNRYYFGALAESAFGLEDWTFGLGLDLLRERPETWNGIRYDEGNVGRTDILVDATVSRALSSFFSAVLGLKVPLYTHGEGVQISYPAILSLGFAFRSDGEMEPSPISRD
jgi:hypothetical protein